MKQRLKKKKELYVALKSLSCAEWKTLIRKRLLGLEDELPPIEIRIDEENEDIFIRLIPQLNNPKNAFDAIISLYEDEINSINGLVSFEANIFTAIIVLVRFVIIRNYDSNFDDEILMYKHEISIKAYKLTHSLQNKLQNNEDDISKRLLKEASYLLEDIVISDSVPIINQMNIEIAGIYYSSLKGGQ